jgi:hypothetical protein
MESPASKKPKIELAAVTPGTSSFTEETTLTPGVSGISFFKEEAYDYSTVSLLIKPIAIDT